MKMNAAKVSRIMRGFSLLELVAVLSIAAILLSVGIPNFYGFIQNQRITTITNDFFYALNLTRSEALKRGMRVDLVPIAREDWSQGWIIFINQDHLKERRANDNTSILLEHALSINGLEIKTALTDNSHQYIAYNGTGRSHTDRSAQQPQSGVWEFKLNKQTRLVKVGFLGRPRVCNPATAPDTCQFNTTSD
jgi:type IV fimbrial biogenesis protein FimT